MTTIALLFSLVLSAGTAAPDCLAPRTEPGLGCVIYKPGVECSAPCYCKGNLKDGGFTPRHVSVPPPKDKPTCEAALEARCQEFQKTQCR